MRNAGTTRIALAKPSVAIIDSIRTPRLGRRPIARTMKPKLPFTAE
jgi:hypothetical protein